MAISLQADSTLPQGYILVDGQRAATISTTGLSATLADGIVTNLQIASNAAIDGSKIDPLFLTSVNAQIDGPGGLIASRADNVSNGAALQCKKFRGTHASKTAVLAEDQIGRIRFFGYDGANEVESAVITAAVDGTPGPNDMPGRLVFSTTADGSSTPTERMRITSNGEVNFGTANKITVGTGTGDGATFYSSFSTSGVLQASNNNNVVAFFRRRAGDGVVLGFYRDTVPVGNIAVTTTATTYNEFSDYRLKQNIQPMIGGLNKLMQLRPRTYEFKVEPDITVDGFIAHEVAEVVPRAVSGEKDGEEMQGLDMSKLVPVLVSSVQELKQQLDTALQEIAELKSRL